MVNSNTASLSFMHLYAAHGLTSYATSALLSELHDSCFSARTRLVPISGLAHGRIVSISKGSPPPKKR